MYKFRLYLTNSQKAVLQQVLDACRFLYNLCLEQRKLAYEELVVRNKSFHSFFSRETDRDSTIGNRPIVELLGRFPIDRIAPV